MTMQPLHVLPVDFQANWRALLHPANDHEAGAYRLVNIRRTQPKTYEELRLIVRVIDENEFPLSGVKVAFSYSTAHQYLVGQDFTWLPPAPHRADIFPTNGGGQIEHIQNEAVKPGEAGGITVYIVEPAYASDHVSGCGMLADHTGMHLTFQLRRVGVKSLADRVAEIETRLDRVETMI